jgi:hypothetical protein
LDRELASIRRAADGRLAAQRTRRRWRRVGAAATLAGLAAAVGWRVGWPAAVAVLVVATAVALILRRRPPGPRLAPQPAADTFEDVVQELGSIKATLQHRAVTGEDVHRLLQSAEWLDRRGGELLGRDRSPSRPAG